MPDVLRPAPRFAAPPNSMAAAAVALASTHPLSSFRAAVADLRLASRARALLAPIEPWYEWSPASLCSVKDEVSGDGHSFTIDWLGLHLSIMGGRTPRALVSGDEVAA